MGTVPGSYGGYLLFCGWMRCSRCTLLPHTDMLAAPAPLRACPPAHHPPPLRYKNLDKLIHYANQDGRLNAFYSTPST